MRYLGLAAGLAVTLAACGSAATSSNSTPTPAASATAVATAAPTVASVAIATGTVAGIGTVVVDVNGHTLYHFTAEASGTIACTGGCPSTWPPAVLPAGETVSPSASLPGKFGTVTRPDGSTQITYNSWPLYAFAGDTAAGQAKGQGLLGKWFAATPGLAPPGATAHPTM